MEDDGSIIRFANRMGSEITIVKISNSDFVMSGFELDFIRYSMNGDEIVMFDPAGGPFITAVCGDQPGSDMGYFNTAWKDLVIEKIEIDYVQKIARLGCRYTKPIHWETVKN